MRTMFRLVKNLTGVYRDEDIAHLRKLLLFSWAGPLSLGHAPIRQSSGLPPISGPILALSWLLLSSLTALGDCLIPTMVTLTLLSSQTSTVVPETAVTPRVYNRCRDGPHVTPSAPPSATTQCFDSNSTHHCERKVLAIEQSSQPLE